MKKKIIILISIILIALGLGFLFRFLTYNKQAVEELVITDPVRQFDPANRIPVSNSTQTSKYVSNPFYAYDDKLDLENFVSQNNLYYKKIVSYIEYLRYKEILPELRELTRDDFINYYLVLVVSTSTDKTYTYNDLNDSENSIELEIYEHKTLSTLDPIPTYSGLTIVLPNHLDVPEENITIKNVQK